MNVGVIVAPLQCCLSYASTGPCEN